MALVGIIDDRKEVRQRLAKKFKRYLKEKKISWDVKEYPPFDNINDYPNWISNNKIIILLVDEKLKEVPLREKFHSQYDGHDLVKLVRKTNKQLPIYIVTAYSNEDDELTRMEGDFEGIIPRSKFNTQELANQQFKKFFRVTQTYLNEFNSEYLRLAELSELVALNKATEIDKNDLKALQQKLQLPLSNFIAKDRNDWIKELEIKTKELKDLSIEIEKYLKE